MSSWGPLGAEVPGQLSLLLPLNPALPAAIKGKQITNTRTKRKKSECRSQQEYEPYQGGKVIWMKRWTEGKYAVQRINTICSDVIRGDYDMYCFYKDENSFNEGSISCQGLGP